MTWPPVRRLRSRSLREFATPLLVLVVATAVSFGSLLVAGVNRADEAWNLQLIQRMLGGDVVYRDLRYYPTPLALFVGLGAAKVFGAQMLMFKALVAVSFGVTTAAGVAMARMLSGGRRAQILVVVGCLLFALPPPSSLYNTLAITFASLTALAVLRWDTALAGAPARLFHRAGATGLATGACLLTKYNVGAAVALAVAGSFTVALVQRRIGTRAYLASAAAAAGACLLAVCAGMAPVLLQGAADDFARQITDGSSLLDAAVPYSEGWTPLVDALRVFDDAGMRAFAPYALLPLAAAIGVLAVARTAGPARARLLVLCFFSVAAAVVAVPRADHVVWAVPLPIALLTASAMHLTRPWHELRPALAASLRSMTLGFVAAWAALALVGDAIEARDFERVPSGPLAGALLHAGNWRDLRGETTELAGRIGTDRKVFIVSLEAASYYLIGDLRNPTRFDYPDDFEFGAGGVAEVKAALVNYTINFTCISRTYSPELEPEQLIATVKAHSRLVARLRACDLWRTGAEARRR